MQVPFAFSISHFLSSVGADAGFAAIIGLAILVLLYFAQARETSTLREEATAASQRVGELERRVSQMGQSQVAPAPRPGGVPQPAAAGAGQRAPQSTGVPAPVPAAAANARPLAFPGAPAGVGAPALFDATRLIPVPQGGAPAVARAVVSEPVPAEAAASVSVPDRSPAPVAAPAPAAAPAQPATATALATPPPATAAGGAQPARAPQTAASNGTGEHAVSPPADAGGAPPRIQIRPGASVPPGSMSLGGARRQSRARRWVPVVLAVLLAVAVAAVLLVVTSTGGSPHSGATPQNSNAPTASHSSAFHPSSVTVAVLNGTDVFQLAHRVAQKLARTGYRQGTVATATDQTHTTTLVGYLPGHRNAGLRIAKTLGLGSSTVQPADQTAKTVACPPPAACGAKVIVTVGSDLSSTH